MNPEIDQTLKYVNGIARTASHLMIKFQNDYKAESGVQLKIKDLIGKYLSLLTEDALTCSDLLFEISTCEDDRDLQILLDTVEDDREVIS